MCPIYGVWALIWGMNHLIWVTAWPSKKSQSSVSIARVESMTHSDSCLKSPHFRHFRSFEFIQKPQKPSPRKSLYFCRKMGPENEHRKTGPIFRQKNCWAPIMEPQFWTLFLERKTKKKFILGAQLPSYFEWRTLPIRLFWENIRLHQGRLYEINLFLFVGFQRALITIMANEASSYDRKCLMFAKLCIW